jgi:hypothetical protein
MCIAESSQFVYVTIVLVIIEKIQNRHERKASLKKSVKNGLDSTPYAPGVR